MLLYARLVCSEDHCAVLYEAVASLGDLDSFGCECGAGLQVLGWPQPLESPSDAELVLEPV